jgi:hypothetical protein
LSGNIKNLRKDGPQSSNQKLSSQKTRPTAILWNGTVLLLSTEGKAAGAGRRYGLQQRIDVK